MKNQAQGLATLYLLKDTKMNEETFNTKFHPENIVAANLQFTLSDGTVHTVNVMELMDLEWSTFQNNKKDKEKPLSKA